MKTTKTRAGATAAQNGRIGPPADRSFQTGALCFAIWLVSYLVGPEIVNPLLRNFSRNFRYVVEIGGRRGPLRSGRFDGFFLEPSVVVWNLSLIVRVCPPAFHQV
jgi:hypothetical protein